MGRIRQRCPFFAKDARIAYPAINARAETVATSPVFREPMKHRRCLIHADFFLEWKRIDPRAKQPYAIAMLDDSLFAFAGLWDTWEKKATGQALSTYSVVITEANELISGLSIHDRMPVLPIPRDYERWLAPAEPSQLPIDLLRPFPAEELKAWKVSAAVGNVRNNSLELLTPIE
jgi:putative SOS response-associated peptidase YedK